MSETVYPGHTPDVLERLHVQSEFMEMLGEGQTIRKQTFAKAIKPGDAGDDVFMIEEVKDKEKKNGEPYLILDFRDKTGVVVGKWWSFNPETDSKPKAGDVVKVRFVAEEYRKKIELNVKKLRQYSVEEATQIALEDFLPVGPFDRFERQMQLQAFVEDHVTDRGLMHVCVKMIDRQAFRDCPAAERVHHAYVGGLQDHVFSMMQVSVALAAHYKLDLDVLLAACVFHDAAKTLEYSVGLGGIRRTDEGVLVGHVGMGLEILREFAPAYFETTRKEFPQARDTWNHLRHLVASHHGQLEWGAVKTPASREAAVFHLIDMLDSKNGLLDTVEEFDERGLSEYHRQFGGEVWRPTGV